MFGLKFRRQVPIENFIVDFYCHELRLIIELDGGVHDDPKQVRRDEVRNLRLEELGYPILRVPNGMVMKAPDVFAEKIGRLIPSPGPPARWLSGHPLPVGEGPASPFSRSPSPPLAGFRLYFATLRSSLSRQYFIETQDGAVIIRGLRVVAGPDAQACLHSRLGRSVQLARNVGDEENCPR